jgi:hypothetical protein
MCVCVRECVFVFVSSPTALRHLDSFYNSLVSRLSSAVFTILISHLMSSLSSIVDSFPLLFLLHLLSSYHHPLLFFLFDLLTSSRHLTSYSLSAF